MIRQKIRLVVVCSTLLPLTAVSAQPVEGPFKSDALAVQPGRGGISLQYSASKRSSNRWVAGPRGMKVAVDVGIVGHGVEAYLSLTDDLVVLDGTTKKTLWAESVGAWYRVLSFVRASDAKTEEDMVLLGVGRKNGPGRFFEIRTGKEKYVEKRGEELVALDEKKSELRGKPLDVKNRLSGHNSKIKKRRCVRIMSRDEWAELWEAHAGNTSALPEVDFGTHMVVGVFHGQGWNCSGIALRHALDCPDMVELFVRGLYYQTGSQGNRVTPYGMYVIPRSPKRLLVKEDTQGLIGGPSTWNTVGEFEPLASRRAGDQRGRASEGDNSDDAGAQQDAPADADKPRR